MKRVLLSIIALVVLSGCSCQVSKRLYEVNASSNRQSARPVPAASFDDDKIEIPKTTKGSAPTATVYVPDFNCVPCQELKAMLNQAGAANDEVKFKRVTKNLKWYPYVTYADGTKPDSGEHLRELYVPPKRSY